MITIILSLSLLSAQNQKQSDKKVIDHNTQVNLYEPEVTEEEAKLLDKISSEKEHLKKIDLIKKAIKKDSSPALDFALGVSYQRTKEFNKAIKVYQNALKKKSNFYRARYNLAQVYIDIRAFEKAVPQLIKLKHSGYDHKQYLEKALAWSYYHLKKYDAAEIAFKQAILVEPDDKELKYALVNIYQNQSRYDDAEKLANLLLKKDLQNKQLWQLKIAASHKQNKDSVLVEMEMARRLNALPAHLENFLADQYSNQGMPDLAINIYKKKLDSKEPPIDRYIQMMKSFNFAGLQAEAKTAYEQLKAKESLLNAEQKFDLAMFYGSTLDSEDKAFEYYKKLIVQYPLKTDLLLKSAELAEKKKEDLLAEQYYERIIRHNDKKDRLNNKLKALMKLSQLHVKNENYQKAVTLLETAIQIEDKAYIRSYLEQVRQMIK